MIAGPRAFKIILLARLTPIPFGLQNTIFGVSNISVLCDKGQLILSHESVS